MTPTIIVLLSGLATLLVGVGLLGTLLGVRASVEAFSSIETGMIMAGYYVGYILGTLFVPRILRNVGHIRTFAALAAVIAAVSLGFGMLVHPLSWLVLRILNGLAVVGVYMVVESWISEQSAGPSRGRVFSIYMMSTLVALGGGQFLLLVGDVSGLLPFALATILITLGVIPIAITRINEPQIQPAAAFGLRALFRVSPLGAVGAFAAGVVNGAFWGMTAVFGHAIELDKLQIALLMSTTILGGALLQWPIGHLSDRHDRRKVLIGVSLATGGLAAAVAYIVLRDLPGLIVSAGIYGGLMFSLYGLCVAHTNDHLPQGQVLEATRGMLLTYGIGALTGPLLGGVAMQLVGPVGLPAVSSGTAIALALYGLYRMTRRLPPPIEDQSEYVPMVRTSPIALELYPEAEAADDATDGPGEPDNDKVPR
ncbi:MAG: MFS transporter [Gammaproteobacteria bacterium]|nr:MFS transporter [Gammaproteobacteria bacterium]